MNVKIGDQGQSVKDVQQLLVNNGYKDIQIDGIFGLMTQASVKDFQKNNGLNQTGVIDDATFNSLHSKKVEYVKGVDISHYQPKIDWVKVKSDNVKFAYIKTTEGVNLKDALAKKHAEDASKHGIKIGYYHFASLNDPNVAEDATSEAKFFDSIMKTLPKYNILPVLDIETNKSNLKPVLVEAWINTFVSTMKSLGHPDIMLYSYTPFLDQNLPKGHKFGNMPLWIAQYRNVEQPTLPKGWSSYVIWQYTNVGPVDGIGNCDCNKAVQSLLDV